MPDCLKWGGKRAFNFAGECRPAQFGKSWLAVKAMPRKFLMLDSLPLINVRFGGTVCIGSPHDVLELPAQARRLPVLLMDQQG